MQLRQPEALRMLDNHDRGVRHVDADLDDGGGDEDRERARGEPRHHAILLFAGELTVHQTDAVTEALSERGVALLCRGEVEQLGLLDQRADPIDLVAPRQWSARSQR